MRGGGSGMRERGREIESFFPISAHKEDLGREVLYC